ncbi:TIGR01777 family oxidoreductase [Psychrobacter sp.]|uniref:TIGR01777 family oxidoreductase n=1 Tax=Psychrobacter sp. TaxID=56811 RepID=UPI0026497C94|nr:TIGR01777 family oxidoreductase [Psychrobacter sp.]MDN6275104.1 TIGR01777 family oxidoreductase [Psychrobacter sp.]MDN6307327.1 TIGR01777 family oxidoreductase [Psychrobacter sp.]
MNILISGGTGFLGSAFSREVIERYRNGEENHNDEQNIEVTWLTRDSSHAHPSDIKMMTYDELATTDESFDVILNLAGAGIADSRWSDERKEQLLASRINPTESILAFIARTDTKPKLLTSGSAIGWYGTQGEKPLDESSDFETDFSHQLCDKWEQLALTATDYGVPVAIVRTGVVIHPEGGMVDKLLTPFKMGVGGQLGDGQQIMSWISREDWIGATIFIIEQHLAGKNGEYANTLQTTSETQARVYNLTSPNPVNNHAFTKTLGAWLNRPTVFTLPAFLLKLMFGEMSILLIEGQKVLPQALQNAGYEFKHPTLKQALEKQNHS